MENGMVHIYCGDGKGKTTAAVGLAVRCVGGGGKVLFVQYLKDGKSSETAVLHNIGGVDVKKCPENMKFVFEMTAEEKAELCRFYRGQFEETAKEAADYDMIVLDEVLHAVNMGFLPEEELVSFLDKRPCGTEIVLTGRDPSEALCQRADYITDMKKIKHPYDKGVDARKMIEM